MTQYFQYENTVVSFEFSTDLFKITTNFFSMYRPNSQLLLERYARVDPLAEGEAGGGGDPPREGGCLGWGPCHRPHAP